MSVKIDGRVGRIALPDIDSTNAEGFRRAASLTGPTWITAGVQTAGRGRRARPWSSPLGNFHGTLVLKPHEPAETVALRSFAAALALRDAMVTLTGLPASFSLKWPNDVLLNGGKLAGILLESQGLGGPDPVLCIGFGVNLIAAPNASQVEPGALAPVSVLHETGLRLTPSTFLDNLAPAYAKWEANFRTEGFAPIRSAWLDHAARLGEPIRARTGAEIRDGVFETIDAQGNLILRMANGTVAIPAAEVFFRPTPRTPVRRVPGPVPIWGADMLLAIDCGNTNTVFSVWDGKRFLATWRIATDHKRTADEYFVWLSSLMMLTRTDAKVNAAIISSTVPRVVFNLRVLCDRYFGCRPLVVGKPDCKLPVPPRVDQGTTVGPDRLVNTVAGHERHGGDLIIVDFGTATTFDVVDHDGAYVGGVIAPGVNLSLEALHMAAAALPHIDVAKPDRVIGTNTVACMQSGVYWGYVGLIEGIVREVRRERDRPMKVIATGGLASLFAQGTELFHSIEDDLTMRGLVLINDYNKDNS